MTVFSLRQVRLRSGEEFRDEVEVVVEPLELGGQHYLPVPDPIPAALAIHQASTGSVFELSFRVRLHDGRSRLRVVMPTSQTAPGYITGTSKVLTVNR